MSTLPATLRPPSIKWPMLGLLECLLIYHENKREGLKLAQIGEAISMASLRVCMTDCSATSLVHGLQRELINQCLPWRIITHGEFFRLEEFNRC